ncbi:hypothetical protein HAX54_015841 [Datura stramonium]|uniref:Uncharacterized protein n=1 Tax=Datura stramonium TaxID=4076 RepID=A0ABS8UIJ1_DATST|nr:hypothetical protein [Datura stramonium]
MENLNHVELTEAQLVEATQNAQQGLINQTPINRRSPPAEEPNLEQTGSGRVLGPMEETRAEKIDDEKESLSKLDVANKLVVINVEPYET